MLLIDDQFGNEGYVLGTVYSLSAADFDTVGDRKSSEDRAITRSVFHAHTMHCHLTALYFLIVLGPYGTTPGMLHAPLCHGLYFFLISVYPIVTVFSSHVLDTNTRVVWQAVCSIP